MYRLLIVMIIFSPLLGAWLLDIIAGITHGASGNLAIGIYFVLTCLSVPVSSILGLVTSYAVRNTKNAKRKSLLAYSIVPAVFLVIFTMNAIGFFASS